MSFLRFAAVVAFGLGLTGCSGAQWGQLLKNTAAGTAESACRSSSSCSTGINRDPLSPKPAWQTGGAPPKDSPYRLPPAK